MSCVILQAIDNTTDKEIIYYSKSGLPASVAPNTKQEVEILFSDYSIKHKPISVNATFGINKIIFNTPRSNINTCFIEVYKATTRGSVETTSYLPLIELNFVELLTKNDAINIYGWLKKKLYNTINNNPNQKIIQVIFDSNSTDCKFTISELYSDNGVEKEKIFDFSVSIGILAAQDDGPIILDRLYEIIYQELEPSISFLL